MASPFLGEIRMFAGSFAPRGWAFCNGQILPIAQNTALFSLLGTYYGGNGVNTFALPDLRGRVPLHWGQSPSLSPYVLGEITGSETVQLLANQMPQHTHLLQASANPGTQAAPNNAVLAVESTGTSMNYANEAPGVTMSPNSVAPAGGNVPVSVMQPILAVSFIIALEGIYPSRN